MLARDNDVVLAMLTHEERVRPKGHHFWAGAEVLHERKLPGKAGKAVPW